MRPLGFWASERSLSLLAAVIVLSVFVIGPLTPPVGPGKVVLALAYLAILITGVATVSHTLVSNVATAGARGIKLNDPMAYFSFTTLTTVGYGDVTPQTPLTQSLANVEALIGQLFPAILIARLVALEIMPRPDAKA